MSVLCFGTIERGTFKGQSSVFVQLRIEGQSDWKIVNCKSNDYQSDWSILSAVAQASESGFCHWGQLFEFTLEYDSEQLKKSGQTDLDSMIDSFAKLNLPSKSSNNKSLIPLNKKLPSIEIRVGSLDRWKCQSSIGVGRVDLPTAVGCFNERICIRAPVLKSPIDKLKQKFLRYSFDFDQFESAIHNQTLNANEYENVGQLEMTLNLIYCERSDCFLSTELKEQSELIEQNIERVLIAFRTARNRMMEILKHQEQLE